MLTPSPAPQDGKTPLQLAVVFRHEAVAQMLREAGAHWEEDREQDDEDEDDGPPALEEAEPGPRPEVKGSFRPFGFPETATGVTVSANVARLLCFSR